MYSPALARFQSRDPLPLRGQPDVLYDNNGFGDWLSMMRNLYGYAGNNPLNRNDPSGLATGVDDVVVVTATGTGGSVIAAGALPGCALGLGAYYLVTKPLLEPWFTKLACKWVCKDAPPLPQKKKCKLAGSGFCNKKTWKKPCTYDCGPDGQLVVQINCPEKFKNPEGPPCPGADGSVVEW